MFLAIISIILAFFLTTFFGYFIHWVIHQPWSGKLNKEHLLHHDIYPPIDFNSSSYRNVGNGTFYIFLIGSLPLIVLPFILYFTHVISLWLGLVLITEMGILGWMHDYIHEIFHLKNHFLFKFKYFNYLVKLHLIHHQEVNKNLGIFSFHWDRIFRSFQKD